MKRSCALADIARKYAESSPGGRRQPEGESMVKSILIGPWGISPRQGSNGISNARRKPVNRPRTLATFYDKRGHLSMTGGSSHRLNILIVTRYQEKKVLGLVVRIDVIADVVSVLTTRNIAKAAIEHIHT